MKYKSIITSFLVNYLHKCTFTCLVYNQNSMFQLIVNDFNKHINHLLTKLEYPQGYIYIYIIYPFSYFLVNQKNNCF